MTSAPEKDPRMRSSMWLLVTLNEILWNIICQTECTCGGGGGGDDDDDVDDDNVDYFDYFILMYNWNNFY